MRRQAQRIGVLLMAGFVVYKITVAAFGTKIPGQPFYGFGLREWFAWILSPSELAFILTALIVEYGLLYFVTYRLSTSGLAVWGALLGAYIAILLFPFDLLATIDNLPDRYWPPGLVGAALELIIFFAIVPFVLALGLLALRRSPKQELTA
jgi:hypothetical protein